MKPIKKITYKSIVESYAEKAAVDAVDKKMKEEKTVYDFSYTYKVIMHQAEEDIYWECFVHVILPELAANGMTKKRRIIAVYGNADNFGVHVKSTAEI